MGDAGRWEDKRGLEAEGYMYKEMVGGGRQKEGERERGGGEKGKAVGKKRSESGEGGGQARRQGKGGKKRGNRERGAGEKPW